VGRDLKIQSKRLGSQPAKYGINPKILHQSILFRLNSQGQNSAHHDIMPEIKNLS
jgi:hypothetical protein